MKADRPSTEEGKVITSVGAHKRIKTRRLPGSAVFVCPGSVLPFSNHRSFLSYDSSCFTNLLMVDGISVQEVMEQQNYFRKKKVLEEI